MSAARRSASVAASVRRRGQIRTQFLAESILLAVVGVLAGAAATALYVTSKSWAVVTPAEAWSGGIASAVLIADSLA